MASGAAATSFSSPLASERMLSVKRAPPHVVRNVRETMLLLSTNPPGISTNVERAPHCVTSQSDELPLLYAVHAAEAPRTLARAAESARRRAATKECGRMLRCKLQRSNTIRVRKRNDGTTAARGRRRIWGPSISKLETSSSPRKVVGAFIKRVCSGHTAAPATPLGRGKVGSSSDLL